jgi:hypothetical protein
MDELIPYRSLTSRNRCTPALIGYEHSTSLWPAQARHMQEACGDTVLCSTHTTRSKNVGRDPNALVSSTDICFLIGVYKMG